MSMKNLLIFIKMQIIRRESINYDASYFNNLKVNIINFFEKNNIVKLNNYNDNKIIFVCGMPRSGTTLVEQIISSHNKVTASGETSILSNIFGNQASLFMGNKQDKILNFFLKILFQLIIIISKG